MSTALYMTAAGLGRSAVGALMSIKNASANYMMTKNVLFVAVILWKVKAGDSVEYFNWWK